MHRSLLSVVLSLSLLLSTLVAAQDPSYTFTPLDFPGAVTTGAYGVNDQGHVVGLFQTAADATAGLARGFFYNGSTYQEVTVAGCDQAHSFGINGNDLVAGVCLIGSAVHGFLKSMVDATESIHDAPGFSSTRFFGINLDGFVVGMVGLGATFQGGVISDTGFYDAFAVPGASSTQGFGINGLNQVVGTSITFGTSHGFYTPDNGNSFTPIDFPGAGQTMAWGLSDGGVISGTYNDGAYHGFLFDGTYVTLDYPGVSHTELHGISADGTRLVGAYNDAGGAQHGFLAGPQSSDTTPPVITVSASPTTLSPPNGKLVTVTVSGMITDPEPGASGVKAGSAAYVVMDEYGQTQPSGNVTLDAGGSYAFTVALEASRRGNDRDGRHYTIAVSAQDNLGNSGFKSAVVTVPHR
jgi:hypothetical protein